MRTILPYPHKKYQWRIDMKNKMKEKRRAEGARKLTGSKISGVESSSQSEIKKKTTLGIIPFPPYHSCPFSSPFLHEMFPWYL